MKRRGLFFLSLAMFASVAMGQSPRAVITGPKEAQLGDLIVLDASESVGSSRIWLLAVSPAEKAFLPVDDGLRCVFATGASGKYTFVLVVAGVNANGGAVAAMATHSIEVVGGRPPDPTPPPTANPYPIPAGDLLTAAKSVAGVKTARKDATLLAKLYQDASRLVLSAPAARAAGTKPEIGTTAELRAWLVSNGRELGLQGKHGGLADAVDAFLGGQLGKSVRDVSEADATALLALAWGVWEGGQ